MRLVYQRQVHRGGYCDLSRLDETDAAFDEFFVVAIRVFEQAMCDKLFDWTVVEESRSYDRCLRRGAGLETTQLFERVLTKFDIQK